MLGTPNDLHNIDLVYDGLSVGLHNYLFRPDILESGLICFSISTLYISPQKIS